MKKKIFLITNVFILTTFCSFGQAGNLDLSFDTDGKITTPITGDTDGEAVAVQADDKILVAGTSENTNDFDFTLLRYNTNGNLDNTFGNSGIVTTDFNSSDEGVSSMVIQTDGKILVAGATDNSNDFDVAIVRYKTDGSLDSTFGTNGIVIKDVNNSIDVSTSIALQTDGKILVCGSTDQGNDEDFLLMRFNTNGTMDNSFGTNGIVTTNVATDDYAETVLVLSSGKIILTGSSANTAFDDYSLVRYNTNGTVDSTFGTNGRVLTDVSGNDEASGAVVQADGKIIIIGSSEIITGTNNTYDFSMVRYNTDGTLDNSFGTNGVVLTSFTSEDEYGTSIALQSDGKIVAAGDAETATSSVFAVARYEIDGSLDTSFSTNGWDTTSFGTDEDLCNHLAIQADGKILLVGETDDGTGNSDIAVARYIDQVNVGVFDFSKSINNLSVYPNPISAKTKITYTLQEKTSMNISLYDISGKLIKTILNNKKQQSGEHTVQLNLNKEIPHGNYFVVLSSPSGAMTLKVIK